jgi:hypothetical protein
MNEDSGSEGLEKVSESECRDVGRSLVEKREGGGVGE